MEELALTINGKKRDLGRNDFLKFANACGISDITAQRMIEKITSFLYPFLQACRDSCLPTDMIDRMMQLIEKRVARLQ